MFTIFIALILIAGFLSLFPILLVTYGNYVDWVHDKFGGPKW